MTDSASSTQRARPRALPDLDIIIPVHNESRSIESSLTELCRVLRAGGRCNFRLIVCEDGSRDATLQTLEKLARDLPIKLVTGRQRKGYGRAVADGLLAAEADFVAVIEGDGQTDPRGLEILLNNMAGFDLVVGWRNPRSDKWIRKVLSLGFRFVYRLCTGVPLTDPSCASLIIRRPVLREVLQHMSMKMREGFFWEFNAWCHALGYKISEVPVPHRSRSDGDSRVYRMSKIPEITFRHVVALSQLRKEIRKV